MDRLTLLRRSFGALMPPVILIAALSLSCALASEAADAADASIGHLQPMPATGADPDGHELLEAPLRERTAEALPEDAGRGSVSNTLFGLAGVLLLALAWVANFQAASPLRGVSRPGLPPAPHPRRRAVGS
jgi:hypothetical protein